MERSVRPGVGRLVLRERAWGNTQNPARERARRYGFVVSREFPQSIPKYWKLQIIHYFTIDKIQLIGKSKLMKID